MVERCPCKKRRPLAEYEEGSAVVDRLYPKASIEMGVFLEGGCGVFTTHPLYGTAKCIRPLCTILRRN